MALLNFNQTDRAAQASPRYISCAETAALVRQALRKAFPRVTFSVRSKTYSGGASITVRWTDGPTSGEVERIAKAFAGASFDGMIDLKSYHESRLENGERVRFAADFVFCERRVSGELLRRALRYCNRKYGWAIPESVVIDSNAYPFIERTPETMARPFDHYDVSDHINQAAYVMRGEGLIVRMK